MNIQVYNVSLMSQKYLYVHISRLQLRDIRPIENEYLSFIWQGRFHFTPTYSQNKIQDYSILINHTLIFRYTQQQQFPSFLELQNWSNNMILFQHEIDITQLKTRSSTKKKQQIRMGEILEFTIHILNASQFSLSDRQIINISQHYLIIHDIKIDDDDEAVDVGPSYYQITTKQGTIIIPLVNAIICILLPTWLQFQHIKNGKVRARSRRLKMEDVTCHPVNIRMVVGEYGGYNMTVGVLWGINLWRNRFQNSLLLDAYQIFMYDFQIKFQHFKVQQNAAMRIKVICGNKAFQLNGEFDLSKTLKFARIIYFITKTQEQDCSVVIQKNSRVIAKTVFGTEDIISYHLNTLKRKLIDPTTNKIVASLKFKCEKAKNLSLPQNNKFWRNCNKGKQGQTIMLQLSQLSVTKQQNTPCGIVIKTQQEQLYIPNLNNFAYFKLESQVPEPISLSIKQESNIYMKMIQEGEGVSDKQFIGIAVINYKDLRLGMNCLNVAFFKHQIKACEVNLLINKIMPYPFIKSIFQPESIIGSSFKNIKISVMIKKIELNQYYYTYQYDGKQDLYCIVQINRIKKVVILQPCTSSVQQILFLSASGSDLLNFTTEEIDSARVKFTLLISDEGLEEEIYGTLQKKIRVQELHDCAIDYKDETILNEHGIKVGEMEFEVQKTNVGENKRIPIKKELSSVKNEIDKVNKSIQKVDLVLKDRQKSQRKYSLQNNRQVPKKKNNKMGEFVLPEIKDPKQQRLKNLAKMIEMKRKGKANKQKNKINYTSINQQLLQDERERQKDRYREQRARSHQINLAKQWKEEEEGESSNKMATLEVMREEVDYQSQAHPQSRVQIEYNPDSREHYNVNELQNDLQQNQFADLDREMH